VKLGFRTLLSILILIFAIGFYLTGFTYNITCPKCGGSGRVWSEWYDFNYHVWVQGYRKCPTCGGSGEVWMYSYISIGLMSFLAHIALFLSFFALNYMITSFHLSRNPWVKDIKQMSFWFNPAWYIWAFHTNRRKWLKWSTAIASIAAIITCVDFGLALAPTSSTITLWLHMTNRDFWIGLAYWSTASNSVLHRMVSKLRRTLHFKAFPIERNTEGPSLNSALSAAKKSQ